MNWTHAVTLHGRFALLSLAHHLLYVLFTPVGIIQSEGDHMAMHAIRMRYCVIASCQQLLYMLFYSVPLVCIFFLYTI